MAMTRGNFAQVLTPKHLRHAMNYGMKVGPCEAFTTEMSIWDCDPRPNIQPANTVFGTMNFMGTKRKYLAITKQFLDDAPQRYEAKFQLRQMLEEFRKLGGTVYVDRANDRFILLDDKLDEAQLAKASEIFDGYPLETVELWVGIARHTDGT